MTSLISITIFIMFIIIRANRPTFRANEPRANGPDTKHGQAPRIYVILFWQLQLIDVKLGLSKTNLSIKELFTLQLVFFDLVCVLINFFIIQIHFLACQQHYSGPIPEIVSNLVTD
jgi:hypothetical protein